MYNTTNGEILQDVKNSKVKPWKEKRGNSELVGNSFWRLDMPVRAERVSNCATWLKFNECPNGHHKKLVGASFCRDRLCPMCSWRRSLMIAGQIYKIVHTATERRKMRFIFLTLTVRNCTGDKLSNELDKLFKGYTALIRKVDKNIIGWIRNLEITYSEKDDTYHPHFHVLIAVPPSYFDGANYISQNVWTDYWRQAMNLNYQPVVNVKAVKAIDGNMDKAVAETAKYAVKDSEYLRPTEEGTDKIIFVLAAALNGRRLIGFGKLFRDIRKELKLKDIESDTADLVGTDEKTCSCPVCNSILQEVLYSWDLNIHNYLRKSE